MSNSQLIKLKFGIKNGIEVTFAFSSNVFGDSKLLLTNTQFLRFRKFFANDSSVNKKLPKPELHEIGQSGGFLGWPFGLILKISLPLLGNVLESLAESVLIPLDSTTAENVWVS